MMGLRSDSLRISGFQIAKTKLLVSGSEQADDHWGEKTKQKNEIS